MATLTEELRLAIVEFKARINSFNFVIDYEEPPFAIGSVESYKAQLDLANEYLEKHPEFNSTEFDSIGLPLYVKNRMNVLMEREQLKEQPNPKELLWDAYMLLDHDERLKMLDKLEKYFDMFGKPSNK